MLSWRGFDLERFHGDQEETDYWGSNSHRCIDQLLVCRSLGIAKCSFHPIPLKFWHYTLSKRDFRCCLQPKCDTNEGKGYQMTKNDV